jgi:hypothetical protein
VTPSQQLSELPADSPRLSRPGGQLGDAPKPLSRGVRKFPTCVGEGCESVGTSSEVRNKSSEIRTKSSENVSKFSPIAFQLSATLGKLSEIVFQV